MLLVAADASLPINVRFDLLSMIHPLTDPVELHPESVNRNSPEFYENQVITAKDFLQNHLLETASRVPLNGTPVD